MYDASDVALRVSLTLLSLSEGYLTGRHDTDSADTIGALTTTYRVVK